MTHTHVAEHTTLFPSGRRLEICECGATRYVERNGRMESWHTCIRCTHPWGMPQPVTGGKRV